MIFQKTNNNPKEWKHEGDCVVRAIASANHTSWEVTYQQLCEIGLKKCRMPNSKSTYELLLKEYGWIKQKMPRHTNGKRFTVEEIIDVVRKPMVISMANHLTYSDGAALIDTWNCKNKSVGNYWVKEDK